MTSTSSQTESYDVIVVGSGIGGLVAALTVARAGRRVLVLEAGKQYGGYCNPFARRHFHFDPGVHYVGECGPDGTFRHLLRRLGLEHVEFSELDPDGFDHYVFPDYHVKNCVGLGRFRDRLAADFPAEKVGLDRFFGLVEDVNFALKASRRVRGLGEAVQLLRRSTGVFRWSRATLKELLDHHFREPRLKAALAGPVGDLGLPPGKLSALMHLGLLAHYAKGAWVLKGGTGVLRDAFVEALWEHGATLKRNTRVRDILHESGRVTGVRTTDEVVYAAPQVISNAQASQTYAMVGLDQLPGRLRRKVQRTRLSYGSIILFAGVDGALDTSQVGSSNVWHYSDTDIDAVFSEENLSDHRKNGAFFLTVPTNKDPDGGLAPEGKQTVEVVSLCSTAPFQKWLDLRTKKRGEDYEALKADIAETMLARAETYLPGLRDHVELHDVATPATNWTYALAPEGNIYGPAHDPSQVMPFRFGTKGPLDGLYLCGASIISAGLIPCASSGRVAGKKALEDVDERRGFSVPGAWRSRAPA